MQAGIESLIVCFLTSGQALLTVNGGREYTLSPNDCVLLTPGRTYGLQDQRSSPLNEFDICANPPIRSDVEARSGETTRILFIKWLFKFPYCSDVSNYPGKLMICEPSLIGIVQAISSEIDGNKPANKFIVEQLANAAFGLIARSIVNEANAAGETHTLLQALSNEEIGKALALIHKQPGLPWTVSELARHCSMSRSAFAEKFVKVTNFTPAQYVTMIRMQMATRLLKESRHSVRQIASLVGFRSDAAFSTAFKRAYGIPPSALRVRKSREAPLLLRVSATACCRN